jgi:hypothetical protein
MLKLITGRKMMRGVLCDDRRETMFDVVEERDSPGQMGPYMDERVEGPSW